jgi:uncharacterized membrane protein SpoIIM required for sporulation
MGTVASIYPKSGSEFSFLGIFFCIYTLGLPYAACVLNNGGILGMLAVTLGDGRHGTPFSGFGSMGSVFGFGPRFGS